MRWVLITAFGVPVEPEVNRNFAMVSGPTEAKAFATDSDFGSSRDRAERNRLTVGIAADDFGRMQRLDRRQRRRERFCAGHIDRAGIEQLDHALELVEIARHQRIGRRDRRRRHAGMHRRQREQRMIDAVVGENDQWAFGAQPLRQHPAGGRAHLPQRVLVRHRGPRRVGVGALAEKNTLRRCLRPMLQPVADAARVRLQRHGRFHNDGAVGAPVGHDLGCREQRGRIVAGSGGGCRHRLPLAFPGRPLAGLAFCSTREPRRRAMPPSDAGRRCPAWNSTAHKLSKCAFKGLAEDYRQLTKMI